MADDRTYIKVHDGIEDHPKVVALSDKAFRLLVTTWAWSSRHHTDGMIPSAAWNKRGTAAARRELENELVHKPGHDCKNCPQPVAGKLKMHDYLEHQRSAEKIEELKETRREGGKWGSHKRWHVAEKKRDSECEYCTGAKPPPKGSGSDRSTHKSPSSPPNEPPYGPEYPETETETDKELRDFSTPLPVGDARARGRGATGPSSAAAYRLVDRVIGRRLTSGTRTALAIEVAALLAEATEAELAAALERWNERTGIGPRLLGALVDDLRKEAHGATTRPQAGPRESTTDQRVAAVLALARPAGGRPLQLPGAAS